MKDTLLMKNYRLIIIIAVLSAAIARVYAGPVREMPSETLDTVYVDAPGCSAPGRYMWVPDSLAAIGEGDARSFGNRTPCAGTGK